MDSMDNSISSTAMPIPRARQINEFTDIFDPDQSQSQISQDNDLTNFSDNSLLYGLQQPASNSNAMWSTIGTMGLQRPEPFRMEDDDFFQVDKRDLFQENTLDDINDDNILQDLNIDDFLREENATLLLTTTPTLTILQPSSHTGLSTLNFPPQQLLQHHHQQQQQQQPNQHQQQQQHQLHQHQQQQQQQQHQHQQQQQQQQNISSEINIDRGSINYDQQETLTSSPILYNFNTRKFTDDTKDNISQVNSNSSLHLLNSESPPTNTSFTSNSNATSPQYSALQELLKKEYSQSPERRTTTLQLGQSVPGPSTSKLINRSLHNHHQNQQQLHQQQQQQQQQQQHPHHQRNNNNNELSVGGSTNFQSRRFQSQQQHTGLSSSAPTHSSLMWEAQQMWARREPRQHLLSTGSMAEGGSTSSISTAGILSPEAHDFSHDEGYDDSDSDHYEDYSSDNDSDNDDTPSTSLTKKEKFFWQYNVQSKGPKGTRLVIPKKDDPHILNEITDPVFSPNCALRGIKHSGKARKGDGNDLTPNPRKLYSIGKELDKLGRTINDMTPVSELPVNVRPKSRKEKNKLASRACRLKKKAQHEANKIKLFGLEAERKRLENGIQEIKKTLAYKVANPTENADDLNKQIDSIAQTSTQLKIAGTSTDFVNQVLEKIKAGNSSGGLEEVLKT